MPKYFGNVRGKIYREVQPLPERKIELAEKPEGKSYLKYRLREEEKERRKKRLATLISDPNNPRHGRRVAYLDGCRCERCIAAKREYSANRAKA